MSGDPRDVELIERIARGDQIARSQLVTLFRPFIRTRVTRVWLRVQYHHPRQRRDPRPIIDDLVQHVCASLFDDDAAALRQWDAGAGRSLRNFIGWRAEHWAHDYLRNAATNPWREDLDDASGDAGEPDPPALAPADDGSPEQHAIDKDMAARVLGILRTRVSPLGLRMFDLLFVDRHDTTEIAAMMGMAPDNVGKWRQRLIDTIHRIHLELVRDPQDGGSREPQG